jgi:hypothetical protein
MTIPKINFQYPSGSIQTVFDTEAKTALELAAITSKKVDDCIELVNGVEQSAIEATAVVDEMRIAQEQFMTENNDIRQQLVVDNQEYLDGMSADKTAFENSLNASKSTFENNMTTALNTTKNNMDLALSEYETASTNALTAFTGDLNATKTQFVTDINAAKTQVVADAEAVIDNAEQQITDDVGAKLVEMSNDGTLANIINVELLSTINSNVAKNQVVVSETAPPVAETWFDAVGETSIEINGEMIILQEI